MEKFSKLEIGDIFIKNIFDGKFFYFSKISSNSMQGHVFGSNKKYPKFSVNENEEFILVIQKKHPAYDKAAEFPIMLDRRAFRYLGTTREVLSCYRNEERQMDGPKMYFTGDQIVPTEYDQKQQVTFYLELKKLYKLMVEHDTPKHLRKLKVHLKTYFQVNFSVTQWFVPCGAKNIHRRTDDYDHVTCAQCKKKVHEFRHNIVQKE